MKKLGKKLYVLLPMLAVTFLLSGCTEYNQPITDKSTGIWNEFFVYPLSSLIKFVAKTFDGNYGLAIIIVTLIIRFVLLPLMIKQQNSMKNMQVIQPEMERLKKKYASKDAVTQQKLQQEMVKLMQEYKVNPMAGCLPIFIQMPILMAFYHAINRTVEIKGHDFLWFNLGTADPIYVLPILAAVLTFLQQKIMMIDTPPNPQMNVMLWMMPIMILVMGATLPAALSLYWVVGNIFTIIQTLLMKKPWIKKEQAGGAKN
ncbi:MAG: YidC family membrane integrase SpoIIIJ [Bacillaceae bacterium]